VGYYVLFYFSNEYYPADQTSAPYQDIRKTKDQTADDSAMDTTLSAPETTGEETEEDEKDDAVEENVTAKRSRRQVARYVQILDLAIIYFVLKTQWNLPQTMDASARRTPLFYCIIQMDKPK
jgi:hypothetical protein